MTGSARECVWCWKCWFGHGGGHERVAYVLDLSCCWLGQGGGLTAAAAASTVASAVVVVAVAVAAVVAAVAIAAAVAAAAVANTDAAVAAPLDPSFDSPTASVMASASACSSRSSSCSLLCIPMEPAWGIRAVSRMGGGAVGGGGMWYSPDAALFAIRSARVWGGRVASRSRDSFVLGEAGPCAGSGQGWKWRHEGV